MEKNPPANVADSGSIPESGRFPGVGNGNPLQYSCLENSMSLVGYSPWGCRVGHNRVTEHTVDKRNSLYLGTKLRLRVAVCSAMWTGWIFNRRD